MPTGLYLLIGLALALAAAVVLTAGTLLYLHSDGLAAWWYAKKLERSGIPVTEQAFLDAVAKNNANAGGNILEKDDEKYVIRGVGLRQLSRIDAC